MNDSFFTASIIAGSPDEVPLYFDYRTGRTEQGSTPDGKWLARTARIVIGLVGENRTLALETNGSGVTANRLESYFQKLAFELGLFDKPIIDFVPIPSPSLLEEINSFERIRVASAVVTRPNFDWSDFNNRLNSLADESGAHTAEATVKAPRGESLSFAHGLVGLIIGSISATNPNVKDFKLTGRKRGHAKDTIVSSVKHNLKAFFTITRSTNIVDKNKTVDNVAIAVMNQSSEPSAEEVVAEEAMTEENNEQ